MKLDVKFYESKQTFDPQFGEINNLSDGGYESGYVKGYIEGEEDGYTKGHIDGIDEGYAEGYQVGEEQGHAKGYDEGLAARTYETWECTLLDDSVVEKEVALL